VRSTKKRKDKMTTNHTYATHGLWSSLHAQNMSVCLNFIPDIKKEKKHQYKFITKEDQKTGIGENKKKETKREYIFTSYECVMLRKYRDTYIYIIYT